MSILLKQNYHMHTTRCGHATGEDRAYVEAAIAAGYETVGFSDHTPFPAGYPRNEYVRMAHDQLEGYVSSVLSLQKEYQNDIRLLLGLEVEYYPNWFEAWQKFTSPYPFDYFLLGQHYVGADDNSYYSGRPTNDPAVLKKYVDRCIAGMKTGMFLFLAHPDLLDYQRPNSPEYASEMRRLCEAAKELHVPMEINLLGIRENRPYPKQQFWKIAGEVGGDVVFGVDAHSPDALSHPASVAFAEDMVRRYGLHHVQNLL